MMDYSNKNLLRTVLGITCIVMFATVPSFATPEGEVFFFQQARSSFDHYIDSPTADQQQWMRAHYHRLLGWSPHFDERLAWFPNGWAYIDAYAIKPEDREFSDHPEWVLRDRYGNMLYIPFHCSGGICPQFAGDFGNAEFRAHWIAKARSLVNTGYIGFWIDDVNMTWRVSNGRAEHVTPIDPRTGGLMTLENWRRYMAEFMEQIRVALPNTELGHNIVWYSGPQENDNSFIERQILAANYINLERGVTDRGLTGDNGRFGLETFLTFIDYVHSLQRSVILMDEGGSHTQRQFALAGWFAINNGADWMSSEELGWTAPDRWWQGYDTNLGHALGVRYHWNGLIRRDFECGLVLLNKPQSPSVHAAFNKTFTDLSGQQLNEITLDAEESAILMHECGNADIPPDDSDVTTFEVRVSTSNNDAEEWVEGGKTVVDSSDLELVKDISKGIGQSVGIRFTQLPIPGKAQIETAYVQFQVDEVSVEPAQIQIAIELHDSATAFTRTAFDISSRSVSSSLSWSPAPWPYVGQQSRDQRTRDIAPLLQQVVNRAGWQAGGAVVLIFTGFGERNAESYDGENAAAPLLHVEFSASN